jgi:hypothetical protein
MVVFGLVGNVAVVYVANFANFRGKSFSEILYIKCALLVKKRGFIYAEVLVRATEFFCAYVKDYEIMN